MATFRIDSSFRFWP